MKNKYSYYTDENRIEDAIETLSTMTDPERPFTRLVFSPQFKQAREWLKSKFEDAGLECRIDAGGNLIGTCRVSTKTKEPKKVVIGSHIDTVSAGGRFDGIAGIVAGLETVHFIKKNQIDLPFDVEIVDFLGEELNVWGTSCLGSRHMAGLLTDNVLHRVDQDGRQLGEEIAKIGGKATAASVPRKDANSILACFELHIEQSGHLETNKIDIGLVTNIPSICRSKINIKGSAGHSGTTKMQGRKDALVTASDIIITTQELACSISKQDNGHFVATIGRIEVHPNGAATVPGEVEMILDLRASNEHSKDTFMEKLQSECIKIENKRSCKIEMDRISSASVAYMDDKLIKRLSASADQLKLSHICLSSGAGHDMAHLSRIAPVGMVFIPCKDGLSHCPEEFTSSEAIAKGSAVLIQTILNLAQ